MKSALMQFWMELVLMAAAAMGIREAVVIYRPAPPPKCLPCMYHDARAVHDFVVQLGDWDGMHADTYLITSPWLPCLGEIRWQKKLPSIKNGNFYAFPHRPGYWQDCR